MLAFGSRQKARNGNRRNPKAPAVSMPEDTGLRGPASRPRPPARSRFGAEATFRTRRSSRIRPASDQETSRNGRMRWSNESAGQGSDSSIAPGSEFGAENTLKVETRVQIPLGLLLTLRCANRRRISYVGGSPSCLMTRSSVTKQVEERLSRVSTAPRSGLQRARRSAVGGDISSESFRARHAIEPPAVRDAFELVLADLLEAKAATCDEILDRL